MTPAASRASFAVYPFVDGRRRSSAPTTGSRCRKIDFPRYAELHLAGRLPIDRLIDRRIAARRRRGAFGRLRAGDGLREVIVSD